MAGIHISVSPIDDRQPSFAQKLQSPGYEDETVKTLLATIYSIFATWSSQVSPICSMVFRAACPTRSLRPRSLQS